MHVGMVPVPSPPTVRRVGHEGVTAFTRSRAAHDTALSKGICYLNCSRQSSAHTRTHTHAHTLQAPYRTGAYDAAGGAILL